MNNWYNNIKISQIWNVESDGTYSDEFYKLYELEYKYSIAKTRNFNGHDKRKENILKNLRKKLDETINFLYVPVSKTLKSWLDNHSQDPNVWAKKRIIPEGYMDLEDYMTEIGYSSVDDILGSIGLQYYELQDRKDIYMNRSLSTHDLFQKMINENYNKIQSLPSMKKIFSNILEQKKEYMTEEIYDNLEHFNEAYGKSFLDDSEAESWVHNLDESFLDMDLNTILDMYGSLGSYFDSNNEFLYDFLKELYQFIIFPLWKQKWNSDEKRNKDGNTINDTIKSVTYIYNLMLKAKTIEERSSALNAAINAAHQTGMIVKDYFEDSSGVDHEDHGDIYKTFEMLSNIDTSEWDNELRNAGFNI